MKIFAISIVGLVLLACGALSGKDVIYGGECFHNFENAIFTPDGKEEEWRIGGGISMQKAELPAGDASGPWGTSHVVMAAMATLVAASVFLPSRKYFRSRT